MRLRVGEVRLGRRRRPLDELPDQLVLRIGGVVLDQQLGLQRRLAGLRRGRAGVGLTHVGALVADRRQDARIGPVGAHARLTGLGAVAELAVRARAAVRQVRIGRAGVRDTVAHLDRVADVRRGAADGPARLLAISRTGRIGDAGAVVGHVADAHGDTARGGVRRNRIGRAGAGRHARTDLVRITEVARAGVADRARRQDHVGRAGAGRHTRTELVRIADVARAWAAYGRGRLHHVGGAGPARNAGAELVRVAEVTRAGAAQGRGRAHDIRRAGWSATPVQASFGSQTSPEPVRHTVPDGVMVSAGHDALNPLQISSGSQRSPEPGLHTPPVWKHIRRTARRDAVAHLGDVADAGRGTADRAARLGRRRPGSCWSTRRRLPAGRRRQPTRGTACRWSACHPPDSAAVLPVQASARSQMPAEARQVVPMTTKPSTGQNLFDTVADFPRCRRHRPKRDTACWTA